MMSNIDIINNFLKVILIHLWTNTAIAVIKKK